MKSKVRGFTESAERMRMLAAQAKRGATAYVRAAAGVLASAAKAASPGTIGREVGFRSVSGTDTVARAKVGLGVGAGSAAPRPHGHFLAGGTRYIAARGFIRNAFASARSRAAAAGRRAAKRRLAKIWKGA